MRREDFIAACELATEMLRDLAPYDTGNLALNAIQMVVVSSREVWVYVSESIAPYMVYTNEPWIAKRWNGKKNPNEFWFEAAVELISEELADLLEGELNVEN